MTGRFYPMDYPAQSPNRYGKTAPIVKTFNVPLDVAMTDTKFSFGGSSLWCISASDISATATIKLGDQQRDGVPFLRGTFLAGVPFSDLYISCTAQAGKWLKFVITTEENLKINNPDQAFSEVTLSKSGNLTTVADATITAAAADAAILAANSSRREVMICAPSANTQDVRIGDSNTGAARGMILSPGETIVVSTTDVIYAYTGAGTDQTVTITYTED